jgi:transketolase
VTIVERSTALFDVREGRRRCRQFRRRILEMSQSVSALHIGGAFSCLDMVDAIYFGLMRRGGDVEDTFLLSKGHGSLAQYVILEQLGILSRTDLENYCKPGGQLGTHPDLGVPGIFASTGALGHGLAMGAGMALADRIAGIARDVYVMMSDGELQEGSVWEAMMLAPTLKVPNLLAFVDLNDMQSFGHTSQTHPNFYPVLDKLEAFGWEAVEVDGHDQGAVVAAVRGRAGVRPFALVGRTTKGKGVSYMENVPMWHYRSPSLAEYEQALEELAEP